MNAKIVLLPGDGIGPEVTAEAALLLTAMAEAHDLGLDIKTGLIGGAAIDACANPLPDEIEDRWVVPSLEVVFLDSETHGQHQGVLP